jgi:hypothetical protein
MTAEMAEIPNATATPPTAASTPTVAGEVHTPMPTQHNPMTLQARHAVGTVGTRRTTAIATAEPITEPMP